MKKETIEVTLKDIYQFLISECRYGYTRNNHLMPEGAFKHCNVYIEKMLEVDKDFAVNTLIQLCEECINELDFQVLDEEDDEFDNRDRYISFIEWCLSLIEEHSSKYNQRKPYNLERYYANVKKTPNKVYELFDEATNEKLTDAISKNELVDELIRLCGNQSILFNKQRVPNIETGHTDFIYKIKEPIIKNIIVRHI